MVGLFAVALSAQAAALRVASVSNSPYLPAVDANGKTTMVYTAEMMLDGNPDTFSCLLDDSPTGSDPNARPPNGSLPVTGRIVFDLGEVRSVVGLELVSRKEGACFLPSEIDVFAVAGETCAPVAAGATEDGKQILPVLAKQRVSADVVGGAGQVLLWDAVKTRFVGLRVRASHTPVEGMHYNYQIAELRVLAVDQAGNRVAISGTGEAVPDAYPGLAEEIRKAEKARSEEDAFEAGERRFVEQGLGAQQPYPQARLRKDWIYQDYGLDYRACFADANGSEKEARMVRKALADLRTLGAESRALETECAALASTHAPGSDAGWKALYFKVCEARRQARLAALRPRADRIVYTKHYFLSGVVHYAWTDDITDQQYVERNVDYRMGASLNVLTLAADGSVKTETLLDVPTGIVRDPSVSYDGKKIAFSMRRNDTDDDFHLYVMDVATRAVKQLTFGLGVSDIEPCWLPNGDLVFNSSRCIQLTDCWRQSVSNLYTCDGEGRFLRRLGFDQVHTNYPQTLDDGRVIYTRWEYNDRGQIFPQPLFVMNGDGTGQAAFYGGNSWFPTSILHARGVPGTQKVIGIASGHHVKQRGKLVLVDRSKGTQEAAGIDFLAPRRPATAVREDQFGWQGESFQYPYAFDEKNYLVTYSPEGIPYPQNGPPHLPSGVYFMTEDGSRELLAYDPSISCNQAVPLIARPVPPQKPSTVDYTRTTGTYYVQDVGVGQAVEGVPRGTVKALRVVALQFRAADAYYNSNIGEAGVSHSRTPPSINNGSWDVKHVLGTVPVEEDGSAYFEVPARTPVYFQLLDAKGCVVQTMRSWSTLQPGESQACVGCHESKNASPPPQPAAAMRKGVRKLVPFDRFAEQCGAKNPIADASLSGREAVKAFLTVNAPDGEGESEGFSYRREIQPIWDAHCVKCHTGETPSVERRVSSVVKSPPFSLKGDVLPYAYTQCPNNGDASQDAHRAFTASYLNLTKFGHGGEVVNWISAQSRPTLLPPYSAGAAKSSLMKHLELEHHQVKVSQAEKERVACWIDLCVPFCGSYTEANQWDAPVKATYFYFESKRSREAEIEIDNLRKYVAAKARSQTFKPTDFQVFDQGGPEARRRFEQAWLGNNK